MRPGDLKYALTASEIKCLRADLLPETCNPLRMALAVAELQESVMFILERYQAWLDKEVPGESFE